MLSSALREPVDGFAGWFKGYADYEVVVAERMLERGEALSSAVSQWAVSLASKGLLSQPQTDRLAANDTLAAGVLFERLSAAAQHEILAAWTSSLDLLSAVLKDRPELGLEIAARGALSIDLETDGLLIWEIGCAQGDGAARLHDEKAGTNLAVALTDLSERVSNASVVIGHNLVAWDWPIISPCLALGSQPLIWDTLLVQFLMEPQAASHALAGRIMRTTTLWPR